MSKFKVGDKVSCPRDRIEEAIVERTGMGNQHGAFTKIRYPNLLEEDGYTVDFVYDTDLRLLWRKPEKPKEEQLLDKIKQLWERQEYYKNSLTIT